MKYSQNDSEHTNQSMNMSLFGSRAFDELKMKRRNITAFRKGGQRK